MCGLLGASLVAELVMLQLQLYSLACAHGPTSRLCENNFWVIVLIGEEFSEQSFQ
jgi:hypothetical protein